MTPYVIVFNAAPETLEDGLHFFASDLKEIRLREPGLDLSLERVMGVPVDSLSEDLTFKKYFGIQNEKLRPCSSATALSPGLVHFLHFKKAGEIETHRCLSDKFAYRNFKVAENPPLSPFIKGGCKGDLVAKPNLRGLKIPMVNPYQAGSANCDSKFRMFQALKNSGIPTPATRLISRFNPRKADSLKEIGEEFSGAGLYIQPDRGTEGEGCFFLKGGHYQRAASLLEPEDEDFIVRKKVGNILYKGKNFVLRLNVCFDGDEFYADSGYAMVGGEVVSAERRAQRVNINALVSYLNLKEEEISQIKQTTVEAARAVFSDGNPSRLVGVDLVLEKQGSYFPYIIDINPRPVVVGSRIIGSNQIGLGEHYWQGVSKLVN